MRKASKYLPHERPGVSANQSVFFRLVPSIRCDELRFLTLHDIKTSGGAPTPYSLKNKFWMFAGRTGQFRGVLSITMSPSRIRPGAHVSGSVLQLGCGMELDKAMQRHLVPGVRITRSQCGYFSGIQRRDRLTMRYVEVWIFILVSKEAKCRVRFEPMFVFDEEFSIFLLGRQLLSHCEWKYAPRKFHLGIHHGDIIERVQFVEVRALPPEILRQVHSHRAGEAVEIQIDRVQREGGNGCVRIESIFVCWRSCR